MTVNIRFGMNHLKTITI